MDEMPRPHDARVDLGRPEPGRATLRWGLAALWLIVCVGMILRAFLTTRSPGVGAFVQVAVFAALATPAGNLLAAAWRARTNPTTIERVGDDLVITSPAFLTEDLVVPVRDVVEVRHGDVGRPPQTTGWPALTAGPDPQIGLLLAHDAALPAREPAPWTGHEMPRRHRLAVAVLMTSSDPRTAAEAIGTLVDLPAVEVRDTRGS
ncbi:hypothetical protein AWH69_09145 [Janibacter melonis]|uniref:Uncharacterized protein n=1 Tax=Janibacter melonis TaxID=262209 RepID=A0A176QAB8_9MICO|nr:hypothetical protein [Janibacter melonis]OAB86626.1 hypothetical protein AWH69_09145 [Janibacter melonis]